MQITMARGDCEPINFVVRYLSGEPIDFTPDNVYFTVKKTANDRKPLFQKKLSNNTIVEEELGVFSFAIDPVDTDNLVYGTYVFDIEIVSENINLKKTFTGRLELTPEVTHYYNEEE